MRPKKAQQITAIVEAPGEAERGYIAREFVTCGLPMRDPKSEKYTRTNGRDTLTLTSGTDIRGEYIGLPYGSIPRLLVHWLETTAIRTQSRTLHIGDTVNGFLRVIGLDPKTGGGKRSDAKRLKDQWQRLIKCRISFAREYGDATKGGEKTLDMLVAEESETWWDFSEPEQGALFDGYIELSEKFYNAIIKNPVPIDFRAMCALKSSPFAIDLYTWLTWRVFTLTKADEKKAIIPLADLAQQIGSQYSRADNFRVAVSEGLEAVKLVWPHLDYSLSATHLTIRKSPVPIAEVAPLEKSRRLGEVKPDTLSVHTTAWFKNTYPKYDLRAVEKSFRAFLKKNSITPKQVDTLFQDYATKWVNGEH